MNTLDQSIESGKAWYQKVAAKIEALKKDRADAHASLQGIWKIFISICNSLSILLDIRLFSECQKLLSKKEAEARAPLQKTEVLSESIKLLEDQITGLEEHVKTLGEEKRSHITTSATEAVAHAMGKVKSRVPKLELEVILQPFHCDTVAAAESLMEDARPYARQLVELLDFKECSDSDDV